jgi:glycosyltransferase involved in cell wall biosynthesis
MRILHLIATLAPESGGPAQACIEMASAVAARGHGVSIYTTDWGKPARPVPTGSTVAIKTFPVQWPRGWKPSVGLAQALRRDLPSFDVVHLHSLYLFHDWVGGDFAHQHGVPYIVRPHGLLDPYIRRRSRARKCLMEIAFQNRVLRRAAAIHYTSDLERDISARYDQGALTRVVPLGVRLDGFENMPPAHDFIRRFPATAGRRIVLFLSRVHEKKGLDLLIPAFAAARKSLPDLHLVIAGPDDGMLERARALARQHQVEDEVTFTGMLIGADKLAAFSAASMFALPSYSENFGIAIVEAMAAGLPAIVSDQVNIYREIEGGGAIVVPCEVGAVTRAIESLAADPVRLRQMAAEARETARKLYDWRNVAMSLENLYREFAR